MTIVSPLNGAPAFGVIAVQADISDDTRIARVEFYVDGELQEQVTAAQMTSGRRLAPSGTKAIREARPVAKADVSDRSLQNGIWQFDLNDAQAIFLSAEGKARKVDGNGLVSAIIQPDVDIACLQLLPQINSLAVAFHKPQALEDGKYYSLVLADFSKRALIGLEAPPARVVGNFAASPAFQTDSLNHLYYLVSNADQALLRTWNQQRATTLFNSDRPVLEWQVAPEGAIILKNTPTAKGESATRIWHPLLGWIGGNQSLLSESTIRQWSRSAVSRSLLQSNRLESYFPQSSEMFHGHFDSIESFSLRDNLILIAGNQADMNRVELLDRDRNTSIIVPTGSLEVRKTNWLSDGEAILAGFDQVAKKYVLARLPWQPEEPPAITAFCELSGMPRQLQGAGFNASNETQSAEPGPAAGERKELRETPADATWRNPGTGRTMESSQYVFNWDTINHPVANHILRVVAHDDANASGADEITVAVVRVKLDLLAERRQAVAFSIVRPYGQIQFLVEEFGITVAQYNILRRTGAGEFELLKTVMPTELQNGRFEMQDKYLQNGSVYTYRVEAYNAVGQLLGISAEKSI